MESNTPDIAPADLPAELRELLEIRDPAAFEASLDALIRQRQQGLFRSLGHLARDLHESVKRMAAESGGTPTQAPDARTRLREALEMSAQAAHDSLEMAERLRPQAERLAEQAQAVLDDPAAEREDLFTARSVALARSANDFAAACRHGFTEMVVSQSWQDLSGQRLQQVATFIDKVESALLQMVRMAGTLSGSGAHAEEAPRVSTQDEVDRLLSEFGF